MNDKPVCGLCGAPLKFRCWSKRLPRFSEALADCPNGCGCWQVRYWNGRPSSDPYQVKPRARKPKRGSWRLSEDRFAAIKAVYGSVQAFLDNAPLVCMSLQVKS